MKTKVYDCEGESLGSEWVNLAGTDAVTKEAVLQLLYLDATIKAQLNRTNPPPCSRACESKSYEITIRGLRADMMRAASKLSLEIGGGDLSDASDRNIYSIIQDLRLSAKEKEDEYN